jgi:16S rRNA (adenine1518-N6/adenine1519-N6)-dimethyltransferase
VNLSDAGELKGFLRKHGLKADKGLGQHFLCAPDIVQAIVRAAGDYSGCLEVGPGPGILTSFLAKNAVSMCAVEFDPRMVNLLADSAPKCKVVVGDALKVNLSEILTDLPEPRALVSNMPYYITGPLLARFSDVRHLVSTMVLMMQREVGEKIVAEPKNRDRGALSVNIQSMFKAEFVVKAPGECFMPPPKVDSVVLKLTPRSDIFPEGFAKVVKAGHMQPRKTLLNNLGSTFRKERNEVFNVLKGQNILETARGFELTEAQWVDLTESIKKIGWV